MKAWLIRIIITMRWIRRIIIATLIYAMLYCLIFALNSHTKVKSIEWDISVNSSPFEHDDTYEGRGLREMELNALNNALMVQTQVISYYLFWALISGLLIALINQFDSTLKKTEALKRIESALIDLKDKMDRREG